jgi:amidase
LLDYPALAIPVTKVDPVLDGKRERHSFYNDEDRTNWEFCKSNFSVRLMTLRDLFHFVGLLDGAEKFRDAPVGVQVVGRTLQEEALIGLTEIVDQSLKTHQSKL